MEISTIRDLFADIELHGSGTQDSTLGRDILSLEAAIHGASTIDAAVSRYRYEIIEYTGVIAPGDRIVIDARTLTVTKNGVNALHEVSGDFFSLNLGENDILYKDSESNRSVIIRITHRDKFV
ncbi:phage distal tail protein [Paenibacillus sp. HJGM_3]|uniref:phage distal tail protein n=1 Tax=Paenibacillus sp. HJGM_3 TaxID=3379816 RepID=UPI0038586907